MKPLDKTMMAIGLLDIIYVVWAVVGTWLGPGLSGLQHTIARYGMPYPRLQLVAVLLFYLALFVCGLGLYLRRRTGAWLNWLLYPLRIGLVLPTFFPMTALLSWMHLDRTALVVLIGGESLRICLLQRWLGSSLRKALGWTLLAAGVCVATLGILVWLASDGMPSSHWLGPWRIGLSGLALTIGGSWLLRSRAQPTHRYEQSHASEQELLAFFSDPANFSGRDVYALPSRIAQFDQVDDWDWGRQAYYWYRQGLRLRVMTQSSRISCVELLDPADESRYGTTKAILWRQDKPPRPSLPTTSPS